MKIGIEAQRIFRPAKHGMEMVALELIRQIQRLDTVNQYVLFAKHDRDRKCVDETPNFTTHPIPSFAYPDWEQIGLPLALRKVRPDLLHCTANTAPGFCPVPLLLTVHDVIYLEGLAFGGSAYQNVGNLYRRLFALPSIKKARMIITVSNYEKNRIIQRCDDEIERDKISVIYNGVDGRFHPCYRKELIDAFKRQYNLPEDYILFLGNTAPKKNTSNMIRAYVEYWRKCPDAPPVVITDHERWRVEKVIQELKLQTAKGGESATRRELMRKFIFPGYVPSNLMPLAYNGAMLFVYPSLRESFGLPILEAMSCGVPVITSNTSAMPEIAGGAAMLADPTQYKDIAHAMEQLVSDTALRESCRQKGLARAAQFSWENAARDLLSLYDRVLNGTKRQVYPGDVTVAS
jgi:glycosyltransferase involved in cell wall biosynthesis